MEWLWQGGVALPLYGDREYQLTPSARVIVQGYSQDAARESSLEGLEVRVGKKSSLNVLSQMGLELSRKFAVAQRPASWALHLDWIHNYDPKGRLVDLSLSGNSAASFRYSGAKTGADAVRLGGAFDVALSERTTLRLSAEQQIQSQLSTTRGSISLGIAF
jgi:outer membrane autotransporter protein